MSCVVSRCFGLGDCERHPDHDAHRVAGLPDDGVPQDGPHAAADAHLDGEPAGGAAGRGRADVHAQPVLRSRHGAVHAADPIGIAGGLNVYGFAAGDPVSYDDPYGLCEKKKDEPTDCEKFARYLDRLAASSETTEEFVRTLAKQIAGFPDGVFTLNYVQSDPEITGGWGGSGFKAIMNDGDGHPWRHFSAFVVAGYDAGSKTGYLAAVGWEVAGLAPGRSGASYQDVLLGMVGARIGSQLKKGNLQRADVARLVRRSL
jgi:hypothetical protein